MSDEPTTNDCHDFLLRDGSKISITILAGRTGIRLRGLDDMIMATLCVSPECLNTIIVRTDSARKHAEQGA